ncbi:hypothetical protein pb186bvf_002345 [Paramecium bursaria]
MMPRYHDMIQNNSMQPYKPLYLNDKESKMGLSYRRGNRMYLMDQFESLAYQQKTLELQKREKNDLLLRQRLLNQNAMNYQTKLEKLEIENKILQAKLIEEQNRAQLAENKHEYVLLKQKRMEYEELLEQLRNQPLKLPEIYNREKSPVHSNQQRYRSISNTIQMEGRQPMPSNIDKYNQNTESDRNEYISDYNKKAGLKEKYQVLYQRKQNQESLEAFEQEQHYNLKTQYKQNEVTKQSQNYHYQEEEEEKEKEDKTFYNDSQKGSEINQAYQPSEFEKTITRRNKKQQDKQKLKNQDVNQNTQPTPQQTSRQKRKPNKFARRKLAGYFWFMRAFIRWYKSYIQTQEKKQVLKQQQVRKKRSAKNYVDLIVQKASSAEVQNKLERQWAKQIVNKMTKTIGDKIFNERFNEKIDLSSTQQIDIRKQWVGNFSKFFFENLELFTRAENFPNELKAKITILQFKDYNPGSSLFTANRTLFRDMDKCKEQLPDLEKKMLGLEYILFDILIPNIFEICNTQTYINKFHEVESQFQYINLASLMQIFFMKAFQELDEYQEPQNDVIQRIFLQENNKLVLKTSKDPKDFDDKQYQIVKGLRSYPDYKALFDQKQKWREDIVNQFVKICDNVLALSI